MVYQGYEEPKTIDVMVTMSRRLLNRVDNHLKKVGEGNRSAWIRAAVRARLIMEEGELTDEEEVE